jgi:putative transposase
VIQRGNNRVEIFRSDRDYEMFLAVTREAVLRHQLQVHAYALMTNHVHFMITSPTAGALAAAMQAVGRRYVPYFNRRYQRTGGLFEGRYRSVLVDEESYWITCMRYIELNPVRAGLVGAPEAYRWTSYQAHAMGATDDLLTDHWLYCRLGDTRTQCYRCWQRFCAQGVPDTELVEMRDAVNRGRIRAGLIAPPTAAGVGTGVVSEI